MVKIIYNSRGSSRFLARQAVIRITATATGAIHARLLQLGGRQCNGLCCRKMRTLLLWHIYKSARNATAPRAQSCMRHMRLVRSVELNDTTIYLGIVQMAKNSPRLWD